MDHRKDMEHPFFPVNEQHRECVVEERKFTALRLA